MAARGAHLRQASLVENETWTAAFTYDASSRVTSATLPDSSALLLSYNEAGLLGSVGVKIRGRIVYGNATFTEYSMLGRAVLLRVKCTTALPPSNTPGVLYEP